MSWTGVVKGGMIKLDDNAKLPEGAKVEITIKKPEKSFLGSPRAILQALRSVPSVSEEDIYELRKAILSLKRKNH